MMYYAKMRVHCAVGRAGVLKFLRIPTTCIPHTSSTPGFNPLLLLLGLHADSGPRGPPVRPLRRGPRTMGRSCYLGPRDPLHYLCHSCLRASRHPGQGSYRDGSRYACVHVIGS